MSATKSEIVQSSSCPIAEITGFLELNIALATFSLLGAVYDPLNIPTWCLLSFMYLMIYIVEDFRRDKVIFITIVSAITFHNVISFYNYYIDIFQYASQDAKSYQVKALLYAHDYSNALLGFQRYVEYTLGYIYKIIPSKFLGQELMVFSFLLSLMIVNRVYKMFNYKHSAVFIGLICFWPAYMAYGSVITIDIFEYIALASFVYAWLKFRVTKEVKFVILGIAVMILSGYLHNVLL